MNVNMKRMDIAQVRLSDNLINNQDTDLLIIGKVKGMFTMH